MAEASVMERPMSVDERIEVTRSQVDETKALMEENLHKAVDRGFKLVDLEHIAESLEFDARQFKTTSKKLRFRYWAKSKKWTILLGAGILLIVIILVIVIILTIEHHKSSGVSTTTIPIKPTTTQNPNLLR